MIRVAICDENNKTLEKLEKLIKDTLGNEVSVSTHDNVFSLVTYVCDERKGKLDAYETGNYSVSEDFYRPTDVVNLWGDPTKAKNELGWNPQSTSFEELVKIMVSHDMQKVAAEHVANVMRTNLAEYLEKGIVK